MTPPRTKPRYLRGDDPDDKGVNLSHDQRLVLNSLCLSVFAICMEVALGETIPPHLFNSAFRAARFALDTFPYDTQVARRANDTDLESLTHQAEVDPFFRSVLDKFKAAMVPEET